MLPARIQAFRNFPRWANQAMAAGDIAQRLSCRGMLAGTLADNFDETEIATAGLWSEAQSPETETLRRLDGETVQRLIAQLPNAFREVIVLREVNDLSYREIADVTGAPVGTVMSRLARARALLRAAWLAEGKGS